MVWIAWQGGSDLSMPHAVLISGEGLPPVEIPRSGFVDVAHVSEEEMRRILRVLGPLLRGTPPSLEEYLAKKHQFGADVWSRGREYFAWLGYDRATLELVENLIGCVQPAHQQGLVDVRHVVSMAVHNRARRGSAPRAESR